MAPLKLKPFSIEVLAELQRRLRDVPDREKRHIQAKQLSQEMHVDYIVLMGAINELKTLGLGGFEERDVNEVRLTPEGKDYAEQGLPERQLLEYLFAHEIVEVPVLEFKDQVDLEQKLFFIGLNNLKRNKWVSTSKAMREETLYRLVKTPEEAANTPLEELIHFLGERDGVADVTEIPEELAKHIKTLKKRKLITQHQETRRLLQLTKKGLQLKPDAVDERVDVSALTPEMIRTGEWRSGHFKPFNVSAPGPRLEAGRIHPMVEIINEIREIFLSLGFTEIRGPMVESAFFNFDALFQPQDHPAREMHDTFYLGEPDRAQLPPKPKVKAVREIHETGGDTGSTGWQYEWSEAEARRTLLRTHTTATTVRYLDKVIAEKQRLPVKVFSVDRVFRNEKVDPSHLAEFFQIEGIVVDEGVTLADLIGILTEFYRKMGFSKIVTRPGFFPYTEPSMQISVYSDKLGKWLEMGGSGIFRPEVTAPWGIKEPVRVLAWGMGLERLVLLRVGDVKDIRDLYRNPLKWLREVSV